MNGLSLFFYFASQNSQNRMMKNLIIVFLLIIPMIAPAQEKRLTLKDATYQNPEIMPKTLSQLSWMGESDAFTWVASSKLVKGTPQPEVHDTLLSLASLNKSVKVFAGDTMKAFPAITYINSTSFLYTFKNQLYVYDFAQNNLSSPNKFSEKASNIDIHKESKAVAYTVENNLYVAIQGKEIAVTRDDKKGIVNGQSVHRDEFGISKGTFWSPSGNYLAFYRMDETMVTDYPLVNIDARVAEVQNIKYPMAGMKSHVVTVGVFDVKTGTVVFMKTGEPAEQYLTCVTWDPSEKYIYIALLNRDQDHLCLNQYSVATGEFIRTLFEEKNDKYVEPLHPLYFLKVQPDQFVWLSRRDGNLHLYLYNTRGELIKQLTSGDWEVTAYLGADETTGRFFFSSVMDSPIADNLYTVDMKTRKITRISEGHGTHSGSVNMSGKYVLDQYSSTAVTREIRLLDTKGNLVRLLLPDSNPLKDYKLGETGIFTIKASDGCDLYCRLIKPADFDPQKKYPVYFYVYGGPHSQLVTDSWLGGANLFFYYMAQQGYVVFTLDNHGTSNRGLKFEQAIFRNLGVLEANDQIKGVEYLKTLPYVDADRIGVDGWSYGGFMAITLMLKYPGVFKIATAGGPVTDWKYYEVMYGERYMDTPDQNPEGYKNACLLNYVNKLQGKLLIIHGTMDPTVVWQNSLTFLKKCIEEGKQVDYFVYPGYPHNVRGKDRMHLYEKLLSYFDENLKK
jgi:dipeptidyl-peptidase-4